MEVSSALAATAAGTDRVTSLVLGNTFDLDGTDLLSASFRAYRHLTVVQTYGLSSKSIRLRSTIAGELQLLPHSMINAPPSTSHEDRLRHD